LRVFLPYRRRRRRLAGHVAAGGAVCPGSTNSYARAEAFLPWNAVTLTSGTEVAPRWIGPDRFWFRGRRMDGYEFVLVDPAKLSRGPAFDHERPGRGAERGGGHGIHRSQAAVYGVRVRARRTSDPVPGRRLDPLDLRHRRVQLHGPDSAAAFPRYEIRSPDGKWAAFEKNENLWVRNLESKEETQLSTDGATDWGYAVVPEGCCSEITNRRRKFRPPPVLKWSPDSKRIVTHRYDERNVQNLYLLETATGRPKLHTWHYAMPGDSVIPTFEVYVFDVAAKRGVKVQVEKQPGNFTAADSVFPEVRWTEDGSSLFVTTRSRDWKKWELFRADPADGSVKKVLTESARTYREVNQYPFRSGPNWRPIRNGGRRCGGRSATVGDTCIGMT
jgi:hypothetical protein